MKKSMSFSIYLSQSLLIPSLKNDFYHLKL